jgi:hypothetical protein
MTLAKHLTVLGATCLAFLTFLAFTSLPALAASSASSAASDSVTTSLGSVSNSLGRSSDSSKGGEKTAAAGDYTIVAVTAVARPDVDRVDTVRLTLHAVAKTDAQADDELYLYVPRATLVQAQLTAGQMVTATPRPYGTEFSATASREAFFLVLQDEWLRDLRTQVVTL